MALCLSVCLSVRPSQVGVLLKQLNVGSHKQHHTIPQLARFQLTRRIARSLGDSWACCLYIGWSDVTETMVTIRSPFCGYNTIYCVELNSTLRKWLTNKAYLSAITVTNISRSLYLQNGGKNSLEQIHTEQNYVSVTLCIRFITNYGCNSQ